MKRILFALTAVAALAALIAAGCTPAPVHSGQQQQPATQKQQPAAQDERGRHIQPQDPRERYSPSAGRTFLDTLNQGKEIALSAEDLPALEVRPQPAAAAVAAAAPSGTEPAAAAEQGGPRFRIQILASSQIDMVRREKVRAEETIDLPVSMASDQSLFKLYVGDFRTRAEAEAVLPTVRGMGYNDAWIVTTR
jgi:hypothetical protein